MAARLRTLPLAIAGVLVGTALAANEGSLNYVVFALTLLTAILLQVLSNFANDFGDTVSGVDSSRRIGPRRMVQTGTISKSSMKMAIIVLTLLSLVVGSLLLILALPDQWIRILIFFMIGLAAIGAAINYTVGNRPYGYVGLGDLFVFLFFGWITVIGACFLQTAVWKPLLLLPASSLGLFSVGVLNVNNIRDIESDKASDKFSIPVRIGKKNAVRYHILILILGWGLTVLFVWLDYQSWLQFLFIPAGYFFVINIRAVLYKTSQDLDPFVKQMALSVLLFSILFALGQLLS